VVVYKCVVCGRGFDRLAALRGHLRVHGDVVWENFTVRLPKWLCDRFRRVCREHNTTTCQVVFTLLKAFVEGAERGLVSLAAPNPVVINVVSLFGGRPRGRRKWDFSGLVDVLEGGKCFICGKPAFYGVSDVWSREIYLCRKHGFLAHEFEVYRKIG